MKKGLYLVLVFAMALALLAGCSGKGTTTPTPSASAAPSAASSAPASTAPASTEPTPDASKDFTLDVCIASQPETIDPTMNTSVDGATLVIHAFEGLTVINEKLEAVPGAAASYKISDDGLVYTFTLRDDAKWSDGQPVKAQDFVYSWQRLCNPATASDYSYMIDMVAGVADIIYADDPATVPADAVSKIGIKALDDKTVEITLASKCAYFLEIAAFPACVPLRQDMLEKGGDQWALDPATYVGNGPYMLKEWVANSSMTYVKNPNFHDLANLGPTEIKFALMDDVNAMLAAYKNGELAMIDDVPPDEIAALKADGSLQIEGQLGTYYVAFNTQMAPFDNQKIREAFSLVIDRNFIVEKVAQGGQAPAPAFVPMDMSDAEPGSDFRANGGEYYSVKADDYKANCDKARALLAEAGFADGKGFPAVEYIYNTSEGHKAIAEALQNMWQTELGVTVTISNMDWAVFIPTRQEGNFQFARDGWLGDYNDPSTFLSLFTSTSGNNDPQYNNPKFDELMATVGASSDRAERMKLMHEAEDLLMTDAAVAPIYYYTDLFLINDDLKGFYSNPFGFKYFMYVTQG
jgi:oligopeptide transport system substrate-binding protein